MVAEEAPFTSQQRGILTAITLGAAFISLLGIGIIFVSYLAFTALRTYPFRLVLFLLLANFWSTVAYLLGVGTGKWADVYETPGPVCTWGPTVGGEGGCPVGPRFPLHPQPGQPNPTHNPSPIPRLEEHALSHVVFEEYPR